MAAPIKAFREIPIVKEAYTHTREKLYHIIEIENCPELGSIDLPLWHYIHSCVPKQLGLPPLGKAGSNIGQRCEEMVLPLLISGPLDPSIYAAMICDPVRLRLFVEKWITRKVGGRVFAKKKIDCHMLGNTDRAIAPANQALCLQTSGAHPSC